MILTTLLFIGSLLVHSKAEISREEFINLQRETTSYFQKLEKKIAGLEETVRKQNEQLSRGSRAIGAGAGIAFSAILQHDLDNLGPNEAVVFDDIVLNDGQGYDNITGAFKAPVNGVYAFMVFIGQRGANQIFAQLTKNGNTVIELGTEGTTSSHDTQAGNAVIMQLAIGDDVQVKHDTWGTHIESSIPLTTFSGFLLYETESTVVIG